MTPCLRRQKLSESVEDKITKEMDIMTLLNKIRQFDGMLKYFKGSHSKILNKYNEAAVINLYESSGSSSNSSDTNSSNEDEFVNESQTNLSKQIT